MSRNTFDEWHRVARVKGPVRRLAELADAIADGAESGSDEWRTWSDAADGVRALLWLHNLGCLLATSDQRASPTAHVVLLDPMPDYVHAGDSDA